MFIWDNGSTDGTQGEVGRTFIEMEEEGWEILNMIKSEENLGVYTPRDELFNRVNPDTDYVLSIDG